jgi:hypothetical protein
MLYKPVSAVEVEIHGCLRAATMGYELSILHAAVLKKNMKNSHLMN